MKSYTLQDNDLLLVDGNNLSLSNNKVKNKDEGKKYILKFRDKPDQDKPREKMLSEGAKNLTLGELMAVVLGTGTKKEDVLTMSSRIVKEYGARSLAFEHDPKALSKDLNIPLIKALQVIACGELGRRFFEKKGTVATIRTAKDVYRYLLDMHDLPKEHLRGIYLNTHHKVIHDEVISIGTINSNLIHPREVFKPAIEHGAVGIILAHNHPSGEAKPSEEDILITKQLVTVGKIVGINIVDHVIIAKKNFISIDIDYN